MKSLHCCRWMRTHLEMAGEKGFSIIAFHDGDHRSFYIQARPFEKDVVEKYSEIEAQTGQSKWPELFDRHGKPAAFFISVDLPIRYCPSCGADLAKKIRKNKPDFDALADAMMHLAS